MIRHYIKSALKQAKADKVFTAIYIAGVTIAIATTMTMATLYYIRIAPIYPERHRQDTYYINSVAEVGEYFKTMGATTYYFANEYLRPIEGVKAVAAYSDINNERSLHISDEEGEAQVRVKTVSPDFFKVFKFNFLQGDPFSEEDTDGNSKDVIITDEIAELVFGKDVENLVGKDVLIDYQEYRIKGVVESASPLTAVSYAQIYIPISEGYSRNQPEVSDRIIGGVKCALLVDNDKIEDVDKHIEWLERELKKEAKGEIVINKPLLHAKSVFVDDADNTWWDALRMNLIVLLVVLFVPAMNLGGLISGRMDARVGELGIRKAFGADRESIYKLVLSENLVYTLIGGVLGFIVSVVMVLTGKMALMKMIDSSLNTILADSASVTFRPEMFMSWTAFIVALAVCLLLNVASAMIPAWVAMRRSIVESLNEKK